MDPATAQAIQKGTAAGVSAGAGATTSYLDNKYNKKALNEYIKQQKKMQEDIAATAAGREGQTTQAYSGLTAGMNDTAQKYTGALEGTDFTKFDVTAPGAYQGKSVNELTDELMNPQIGAMRTAAQGAVEGSAANSGKLFSGVTAGNVAARIASLEAEERDKARSAAQVQDAANRQDFQNQFANQVTASTTNKGNLATNLSNLGASYNAKTGAFSAQQGELTGIRSAADQARLQSQAEEAAARAQKAGTKSGFAAALSGGLQGLASALK